MEITRTKEFIAQTKKIKDKNLKEIIFKQIKKILNNPGIGKPLRYDLHRERSIYIKPFRLVYTVKDDTLVLLRFKHRKEVYK